MLHLKLLGYPEIYRDGVKITDFVTQKALGLFVYLALNRQTHSRLKLGTLFWPDKTEKQGRDNIRAILPNLRQLLDDYLIITRQWLQFDDQRPFTLDMESLRTAVAAPSPDISQLEKLLHNYGQAFLDGFYLDGSPELEDWIVRQQEQCHQLRLQGLQILAHHYRLARDFDKGMAVTQKILQIEPWRETAYRQRMRLLAYTQQWAAASHEYEQCRRALAAAYQTTPGRETTRLYERIQAQISPTTSGDTHYNLPRRLTPFLGREDEIAQLRHKLLDSDYPLLTISGEGGVGKTRLALQAARQTIYDFSDGVWFIPLAASKEDPLALLIANVLGVYLSGQNLETHLLSYLRERHLLLVLDNFEHRLTETRLILRILQQAPGVHLLVTSRIHLNLQAEYLLRLTGLPLPPTAVTLPEADQFASLQLFAERASRVANFTLTAQNVAAVSQICHQVGGLPLGIELAAALTRTHTLPVIAAHIHEDSQRLAVTMPDLPARHRSIQAVFDYSWQLLTANEQTVLAQCALFAGGFTLDAATAVTGAEAKTITTLVTHSLLLQSENGRYDMHPLLRQFCQTKWAALAQDVVLDQETRTRYVDYFLGWLQNQLAASNHPSRAQLTIEWGNIQQAWQWGTELGLFMLLANHAHYLDDYCYQTNQWPAGINLLEETIAALSESEGTAVHTKVEAALRLAQLHLFSALANEKILPQKISELTQLGTDIYPVAFAYWQGRAAALQGKPEQTRHYFQKGLRLAADDDYEWHHKLKNALGVARARQGDPEAAHALYREALEAAEKAKRPLPQAVILLNTGRLWYSAYHYTAALACFEKGLHLLNNSNSLASRLQHMSNLGRVYGRLGRRDQAVVLLQETIALAKRNNYRARQPNALHGLTLIHYEAGDLDKALPLGQQSLQAFTTVGVIRNQAEINCLLGAIHTERGELAAARACYEQAAATWRETAIPIALLEPLAGLAAVMLQQGDQAEAQKMVNDLLTMFPNGFPFHLRVEDIFGAYWRCYQVLTAVADPRADHLLNIACDQLQQCAGQMPDAAARRYFLSVTGRRQLRQASSTRLAA